MNILTFVIGFGVGTFVTSLATLWTIGQASKPSEKAKKQSDRAVELLAERNAIDAKIERHLCKLADWADNNWNSR